jgi:flotillin
LGLGSIVRSITVSVCAVTLCGTFLASAQAISNIKFDKIVVWDGGQSGDSGTSATAQWLHNMAKTLPPMMQVMKEIGGVDIPETLTTFTATDVPKADAPEKDK